MAYNNKLIKNPKTGQSITFLQTSCHTQGKLLEMVSSFQPFSIEPPPHYHPYQTEDFFVISGELTVRMSENVIIFKEGEGFHVPSNTIHSMWNASNEITTINWKVRPALETEHLLETISGLATDGLTNNNGVPNLLQTILIANKYSNVYRAARPRYFIQKMIFAMLTPLAYLCGYRSSYKKYID
jgi:quercetin dioxygenase-like cupin family protein